jgi:hypothetical protein
MVREAGIRPLGPASRGVESVLHVLALPERVSGRYFNETAVASPDPQARDEAVRQRLGAQTAALLDRSKISL